MILITFFRGKMHRIAAEYLLFSACLAGKFIFNLSKNKVKMMPQNLCFLPFNCSFCASSVCLNRNIKAKPGGEGRRSFSNRKHPVFRRKNAKKTSWFCLFFYRKMPFFWGIQLAQKGWKTPWKPLWKCREIAGDCCGNMNTVWTKNVKFRRFTMKICHCDRHIYQKC